MATDGLAIDLHELTAETESGDGASVDLQSDDVPLRRAALVSVVASTVSGSVTVSLQTSDDEVSWETLGSFAAITSTGQQAQWFGDCRRYVRTSWTLPEGDSATFRVSGEAVQTFCSLAELAVVGGAADILTSDIDSAQRVEHLAGVSSFARGYIAKGGPTPILGVGTDVSRAVAQIAAVDILTSDTGPQPNEEAMELLSEAAERSRRWLRDVGAGKTEPDVTYSLEDLTATDTDGGYVYGDQRRGWSSVLL